LLKPAVQRKRSANECIDIAYMPPEQSFMLLTSIDILPIPLDLQLGKTISFVRVQERRKFSGDGHRRVVRCRIKGRAFDLIVMVINGLDAAAAWLDTLVLALADIAVDGCNPWINDLSRRHGCQLKPRFVNALCLMRRLFRGVGKQLTDRWRKKTRINDPVLKDRPIELVAVVNAITWHDSQVNRRVRKVVSQILGDGVAVMFVFVVGSHRGNSFESTIREQENGKTNRECKLPSDVTSGNLRILLGNDLKGDLWGHLDIGRTYDSEYEASAIVLRCEM
jgi:hypothetical protein